MRGSTMNIYIDESGSINNSFDENHNFIIALLKPSDDAGLRRSYKRYVSSHIEEFRLLSKIPSKMFLDGNFKEIKGSAMTIDQKKDFVNFFCQNPSFELFYIVLKNHALSDSFCDNSARAFNFSLYSALFYFMQHGYLTLSETCNLQLDERNEKTNAVHFLENYLNTQFIHHPLKHPFNVKYFDSSNNKLIQVADVFANIYYSHLVNGIYIEEIERLKNLGILKSVFHFPHHC
jgi:hypothetical protein